MKAFLKSLFILQFARLYCNHVKQKVHKRELESRLANMPKAVTKAWGKEEWLELNPHYCFKRIEIKQGHKTSLQFHRDKIETNHLAAGSALYHWYDPDGTHHSDSIEPGFCVTIKPGQIHRFEALTDIVLFEASTPEVWDVVRLEDDYNRKGTSEP